MPLHPSLAHSRAPGLMVRTDVMVALVLVGLMFLSVGESRWPNGEAEHETIEWIGLVLIVFSIFGRTWCAIYAGGPKDRVLVTQGPYSISRNPASVFTMIGAVGVGAQIGSAIVALACGVIAWVVLQRAAAKEELSLHATFGDGYDRYRERVPRFLPKFSLWHDLDTVEVWPRTMIFTFLDAAVFLMAIPLAEAIEYMHDTKALPVLLVLP